MYSVTMKLSALALLFVLAAAPGSAADTGSCYAIGDADARIYCLARERRDPSQCYAIQRADLRAQCRAEVSR